MQAVQQQKRICTGTDLSQLYQKYSLESKWDGQAQSKRAIQVFQGLDEAQNDTYEPNKRSRFERACLIAKSVFGLSYLRRRLKGKSTQSKAKGMIRFFK